MVIVAGMFGRTTMGIGVSLGLFVAAAHAVTGQVPKIAPTPTTPPVAISAADENSSDTTTAPDQEDNNPYSAIVRANVFHLTDPPKPQIKEDAAILNLPKVNITGFRKREGEPLRALFATVPKDPKEPARYFNLAEGEKEGILELKKIDPDQEAVEVVIDGTPTTLTVKSNSFVQPIIAPKIGGIVNNPGIIPRQPTPAFAAPVPQPVNPNNYGQGAPNTSGVIVAGGGVVTTATTAPVGPQPPYTGAYVPNQAANPGVVNGAPANQVGESPLRTIPTRGIRH
jgi:hypothetical protein